MRNSFFSNTAFIFLSRFFFTLANLAVIIIFSRSLPTSVYGDYVRFWTQLNMLYPVACFGIHIVMMTYSPQVLLNLHRIIKKNIIFLYLGWILLWAGIFTWLVSSYHYVPAYVSFLFFLLFTFNIILETALVVMKRFKELVTINVLYAASFISYHYCNLGFPSFSPLRLFAGILIIYLGRLILYFIAIYRCNRYILAAEQIDLKKTDSKSFVHLWMHLGFFDVSQNFFNWADKFIISLFLTAGVSAVYYNGTLNIPFLPLLLSAAGNAILIQLADERASPKTADIVRLLNQSGKLLSCFVFPLFLFLWFYKYELITQILTTKYGPAVPIFGISIFVLLVRAYNFTTILQRFHKGRILNIGALIDLVAGILLMYPFYLLFGLPGVAFSFVLSTYIQAVFYLYHTSGILQVGILQLIPVSNWLLRLTILLPVFFALHYVSHLYFNDFYSIIFGSIALSLTIVLNLKIELKNQSE